MLLQQSNSTNVFLNPENLAKGIYFVKVTSNKVSSTFKLMKK